MFNAFVILLVFIMAIKTFRRNMVWIYTEYRQSHMPYQQCSTIHSKTWPHYRTGHQTSSCLNQVLESTLTMWSCVTTMVWNWKLLEEYKKPETNTRFLEYLTWYYTHWLKMTVCCYCLCSWLWRLILTMVRCTSTTETCFLMKESMKLQLQGIITLCPGLHLLVCSLQYYKWQ